MWKEADGARRAAPSDVVSGRPVIRDLVVGSGAGGWAGKIGDTKRV